METIVLGWLLSPLPVSLFLSLLPSSPLVSSPLSFLFLVNCQQVLHFNVVVEEMNSRIIIEMQWRSYLIECLSLEEEL